jgi:hypothetical protein
MKPVPYYVLALAMAVPAILVGVEIPSLVRLQSLALQSDFRGFYTAGYMLRTGQRRDLYDFSSVRRNQSEKIAADEKITGDDAAFPFVHPAFVHPAYQAILFMPLSLLPYRVACLVWAGLNLVLLALIYRLLRPCLADLCAVGPNWALPALLLGYVPIAFTIIGGQDSLILLLILVLVYRRITTKEVQAGMLLGLGMFRFQILLPIVALFLLWRGFKFVAGWVASSASVLIFSALITGVAAQMQYARVLHALSRLSSIWELLRRMPNLRALAAVCKIGMAPLVLASLSIVLLAAVAGTRKNAQQRLLLAITVSAVVPYYLWMHDLSVLALPLLVAISEAVARRDWRRAALVSAVLSGFSVFWFTRGKLYMGVLFTLFFFATQATSLWKQRKDTQMMEVADCL